MKTVVTQLLEELLKEYPITMKNEILTNKQFWLDMEKQQIIDAFNNGSNDGLSGDHYYKSNFETDTSLVPFCINPHVIGSVCVSVGCARNSVLARSALTEAN